MGQVYKMVSEDPELELNGFWSRIHFTDETEAAGVPVFELQQM